MLVKDLESMRHTWNMFTTLEDLLEMTEKDFDSKIRSEVKFLAIDELGDFEFLMSIIIWF